MESSPDSSESDPDRQVSPPEGDLDAVFVADLTSHQGMLYTYLNTMLPGDPEVADVLQRANLVLWQKRGEFEPGSNFRAWALSVAYWEARSWMTDRKRKGWLVFDEDLAQSVMDRFSAEDSVQTGSDSTSVLRALNLCLTKLKEADRVIIFQYYQRGKSLAESSQALGRSPGALKVALHRIRGALRKCIEYQLAKGGASA